MTEVKTLTGNTVRLTCSFKDFKGEFTDPTTVKFIIYDNKYNIMSETILSDGNRESIGSYFYDYTTESERGTWYFEFYGEISGNPAVQRGTIRTSFIM